MEAKNDRVLAIVAGSVMNEPMEKLRSPAQSFTSIINNPTNGKCFFPPCGCFLSFFSQKAERLV